MGSITDAIAYDYKERNRAIHGLNPPPINNTFTVDNLAVVAMQGLLASGQSVSYDTAHQAFRMAQMMIEVRDNHEYDT